MDYSKYLSVSDTEENWGFYLTTAGYSRIDSHQSYPRNRQHPKSHAFNWNKGRILDGFYIVFISKGSGVFETGQTSRYTISAGCCFILFPGVWHRYKPDMEIGWEEYWVGFKGFYAEELIRRFFVRSNPVFYPRKETPVVMLYKMILEKMREGFAGYHQQIAGITHQLLGILYAAAQNERQEDPDELLISQGMFLLREHLHTPGTIEEIVKNLPVSYSKFRKDFKKITGETPNQYQLNLRLEKVKELLHTTKLSISEIAYQTGFESISYLSKIFRKKNLVSPRDFRKSVHC